MHWSFALPQPLPLRTIQLRLPPGMGFAASSLGLEPCQPARLASSGPSGCPLDSRIGSGTALAQLHTETVVRENAKVTVLLGPRPREGMTVLFFVQASWPIDREIVLRSQLLHMVDPHGAALLTQVPLLPAWPEGPDIELTRLASTIGPRGLTYRRRAHGRTISFTPRGLTVPTSCPRGGFRLSATFTWWTAPGVETVSTDIPCPRR